MRLDSTSWTANSWVTVRWTGDASQKVWFLLLEVRNDSKSVARPGPTLDPQLYPSQEYTFLLPSFPASFPAVLVLYGETESAVSESIQVTGQPGTPTAAYWTLYGMGNCSVTCGLGRLDRFIDCFTLDGSWVSATNCPGSPPDGSIVCGGRPCLYGRFNFVPAKTLPRVSFADAYRSGLVYHISGGNVSQHVVITAAIGSAVGRDPVDFRRVADTPSSWLPNCSTTFCLVEMGMRSLNGRPFGGLWTLFASLRPNPYAPDLTDSAYALQEIRDNTAYALAWTGTSPVSPANTLSLQFRFTNGVEVTFSTQDSSGYLDLVVPDQLPIRVSPESVAVPVATVTVVSQEPWSGLVMLSEDPLGLWSFALKPGLNLFDRRYGPSIAASFPDPVLTGIAAFCPGSHSQDSCLGSGCHALPNCNFCSFLGGGLCSPMPVTGAGIPSHYWDTGTCNRSECSGLVMGCFIDQTPNGSYISCNGAPLSYSPLLTACVPNLLRGGHMEAPHLWAFWSNGTFHNFCYYDPAVSLPAFAPTTDCRQPSAPTTGLGVPAYRAIRFGGSLVAERAMVWQELSTFSPAWAVRLRFQWRVRSGVSVAPFTLTVGLKRCGYPALRPGVLHLAGGPAQHRHSSLQLRLRWLVHLQLILD